MDVRPDTSSGRSQDGSGWSFLHLNHGFSPAAQDVQSPRSRPASSYLRGSNRSNISPLPIGHYAYNGSRSSRSFSRDLPSASTGARSTTTLPSQPVLSRITCDPASNRARQSIPRRPPPQPKRDDKGLPVMTEWSMAGILAAIDEQIEDPVNTIAEILGRNRFVLADEYGAQMPPQGEITMPGLPEDETDPHYMADNVMILNEDASLVDGSNSGSAAYGLLERLQTVPRPVRMTSDAPVTAATTTREDPPPPLRTVSSPAAVLRPDSHHSPPPQPAVTPRRPTGTSRSGLPARGPAVPVVSEVWLSPDANGLVADRAPIVSEGGRHYPLYAYDDTNLFEPSTMYDVQGSDNPADNWLFTGFSNFRSWFTRSHANTDQDAEARLRGLLNR